MAVNPRKYDGLHLGIGDESNKPVLEILVRGETDDASTSYPRAFHFAAADDANTDWNVAANTHPTIYFHSATAAATCYMTFSHNASTAEITAAGASNVDLQFDTAGTGQIVFQTGGTDLLNFHDVSGVSFVAATVTAGHTVFVQTEDGGIACGATGGAGGTLQWLTGDGGAGVDSGNRAGGVGGSFTMQTGAGGAASACTSSAGGAGGLLDLVGGAGGIAATSCSGNAGAGGAVTITGGAAGAITGGTGAPAVGGVLTLTGGLGSTSNVSGDTAGAGAGTTLSAGAGGAATGAGCDVGGAGGVLELFGGQGGLAKTGGAAGNVIVHLGTAVGDCCAGAIGAFFLRNNTTGLGMAAVAQCAATTAGIGSIWALDGALTSCNQAPANHAILMIQIA